MQQPMTNSPTSFTDTSTNINETLVANTALSSTEKNAGHPKVDKSVRHHIKSPFRSHRSKQPSDTAPEAVANLHGNNSHSKNGMASKLFSKTKTKQSPENRLSIAQSKLNDIIQDLSENPLEEQTIKDQPFEEQNKPKNNCSKGIEKSRRLIGHMMEQPIFHYVIIVLIIVDLIIVFVELVVAQLTLPCLTEEEMEKYNVTEQRTECLLKPSHSVEAGELVLYYTSLVLITIFTCEILTAFYAFGWRRYTKLLYLFDAIIVCVSFILEVYFHFGSVGKAGKAASGLVVLRLWKIIRAIHAIAHSISLRNHMIVQDIQNAKDILSEEKAQAENTIQQQETKIEHLTALLDKAKQLSHPDQTEQVCRKRAKSFTSVTSF